MFRLKLVLMVVGGFICWYGHEEYQVGKNSTAKPMEVELVELEKDPDVGNNHLQIGPHWCFFQACVYEYRLEKEGDKVGPGTDVNHAYYPIISEQHPFFAEVGKLIDKHGDVDKIPDDQWPQIKDFAVLVKTKRYKRVGAIPDEWKEAKGVRGLVINRIEELDREERGLIRQSFPKIDLDKILILEEDRQPTSVVVCMAIMAGGAFLALGSVVWAFKGARKEEDEGEQEPHEEQYAEEEQYPEQEKGPDQRQE